MNKSQFKQLQTEWYNKLKEEGFEDIEDTSMPNPPLKSWSNRFSRLTTKYPASTFSISHIIALKQFYYTLASQFLLSHRFKNALDKAVWELHCEGLGSRRIVALLRNTAVNKLNKDNTTKIIKILKKKMLSQYLREGTKSDDQE